MDPDSIPITRLSDLESHLSALIDYPDLPVDAALLDHITLQLNQTNTSPLIPTLLPPLTNILKTHTASNPTPLVTLAIKLLAPVSFAPCLQLASPDSLILALQSPAPSANILALTILHKAAATPAEAAMLAVIQPLVKAMVSTWLASPAVEVGEKASRVLAELLETDCGVHPEPVMNGTHANGAEVAVRHTSGRGKLWETIFADRDVYRMILQHAAGETEECETSRQQSLAQGRLLAILPRLARLNLWVVTQPGLEGLPPLLPWAAFRMVDTGDELMRLTVVDFWERFVSVMRLARYDRGHVEAIRRLLAEAFRGDARIRESLVSLPERMVEDEREGMERWIRDILPEGERLSVRTAGRAG